MTDAALAIQPLKVPAPTADDPNKRLKIGAKLRVAIDAIVFDGKPMDEAAKTANCTVRSIRRAFEKAHVLAYLKRRREVLRSSACGSNIHRLTQIRDAADNMPAVNAIKMLEQIGEAESMGSIAHRVAPGLTIVVVQQPAAQAPQPTISAAYTDIRALEATSREDDA